MFVSRQIWGHKNTDIYPYTWLISREILQCGLHDDFHKFRFTMAGVVERAILMISAICKDPEDVFGSGQQSCRCLK